MIPGRTQAISILALLSVILVFAPRKAPCQARPGINTFVNVPDGCSYSDPIDANDLLAFFRVQIQALALARRGEQGSLSNHTPLNPSNPTTDRFAGLREERIGDTCAGFILSPYIKSANDKAASVAKHLVADYGELGKMTDERLGIAMQQSLQTRYGTSIPARLSDLKTKRQDIMRDMNNTLTTALSLLVDQSQTDSEGKPGRMILTHEQRLSLRNFLQSQFPSLVMNEKTGIPPADDFTKQAAVIRSFLTGTDTPMTR